MRINNLHLTNVGLKQAGEVAGAEERERRQRLRRAAQDVSRHTPSAELMRFLALVQQYPEVRLEVLARVARHLAAGFYQTRASALKTAEALLLAAE